MKVIRTSETVVKKKLVPCALFEATHNMEGVEIARLERDEKGWISISKDGTFLSHMNADGTAYSFEPTDIEGNEEFHAAKYVEDFKQEGSIQITLTDSEAVILKRILGRYNSLNSEKAFPILDTQTQHGNLYRELAKVGIETDDSIDIISFGIGSCPALSLKTVE